MKRIIEVDSDEIVQDGVVDKQGRIMGLGRYKGRKVTVIIRPTTQQGQGARGHPITSEEQAPAVTTDDEGEEK